MEDLDSLLEDLGRGKLSNNNTSNSNANSAVKKPPSRPASTRVDLNELEDLMEDLAAPTAKQTPTPTPVVAQQTVVLDKPSPVSARNTSNYSSTPIYASTPTNSASVPSAPAVSTQSTTASSTSSSSNGGNVDDLEALMESLNMVSNNKRVTKREPLNAPSSVAPVQKKEPVSTATTATVRQPEPVVRVTPQTNTTTKPVTQTTTPTNKSGPVKGDELDKLLTNLTTQIDHIDTDNPASRGTCATCRGPILGEIIQALGRTYHPEHFTCSSCKDSLGTKNFYEQNSQPICQRCFELSYCPKCAHCDQAITDRCITALGKKWHPDHFICAQCLKPFPNGSFFEKDGRPYCETDFYGLYAPKCGACQEPIKGDCVNALGTQWHPEHFVCTYCGKAFSGSFFEHGGKPYCEAHYHQQTGSLCAGCGKAIQGRCVNALDKKWHPEHFVCAFCMNPLAGGTFSEKNNKAYCKECFGKLFGN